jgi:hypothetical protein
MNKSHHVAPFLVALIVFAAFLVPTRVEAADLAPDATIAQPAAGSLRSHLLSHTSIGLSYFGDAVLHPGLLVTGEYRLLGSGRPQQVFVRPYLGGYDHPRIVHALLAGAELGYRAVARFGLAGEAAAGLGYRHTFLGSTIYEVKDGQITTPSDSGHPSFMPSVSLGGGWDFGRRSTLPLTVMLRSQLSWQIPFNTNAAMRVAALLHFVYSF